MSTFIADYNNGEIVLSNNGTNIGTIPIGSLLLNNGTNANTSDNFEQNQQQVNYLDSVKDGTNVWMLQDLNIYPRANINGIYPQFPDTLKAFEHAIFNIRKDYLSHTTWLKVKKGSVLDPGKNYNECLWESGLGYQVFLHDSDNVRTIKTFGSYIDPLEKQNATKVWPEINSKVQLTEKFMKLMGFGESSSLVATTTTNTAFQYKMNIGCGNNCTTKGACVLTESGDDEGKNSDTYFAGNNEKKQFLKTNASTKQKVKFVVIKEWGDKVQVLIYLIYYYFIKSQNSVIMTTCDMVVFMLCLNLSIPCIYTGAYNPPGLQLDPNKKYYSILEYKPSNNPYRDTLTRLKNKITAIAEENQSFNVAVYSLIQNPDTPILVNGTEQYFTGDFYTAIFNDIDNIQSEFLKHTKESLNKYSQYNESSGIEIIPQIERELKYIEEKYLLLPFLKIKKGTTKKLTILMTKSYTAQKPCDNKKPNIKILLDSLGNIGNTEKESIKSFLDLAIKYFKHQPTRVQRGGALTEAQISLFPEDIDDYGLYNYITNEENENDSIEYDVTNPGPDVPIFNQEITPDKEEYNLLDNLHKSFNETLNGVESENWKDTIYTLFVYESYLNGVAKDIFTDEDYNRIVHDYELSIDVDEPELVNNVGKGNEYIPSSPAGPSGFDGNYPFSPYYNDDNDDEFERAKRIPMNKLLFTNRDRRDQKMGTRLFKPYGGSKNNNRKTRRIIKTRKHKKTRNTKKMKNNKTIKKKRRNKKRKTIHKK